MILYAMVLDWGIASTPVTAVTSPAITQAGTVFLAPAGLAGFPFVTGLMAYYQVFDYRTMVIIHMWTGAIWLAMIPFTRIAHMLYFPLTRAYMGCEFGYVRNSRDW